MVAPPFNTPVTVNNPVTNPTPQFVLGQNIFPAPPSLALNESYAAQPAGCTTAFVLRSQQSDTIRESVELFYPAFHSNR